ncbi:hypothetical protein H4S01_005009, partial [Coemansia sp. RSA 2610]
MKSLVWLLAGALPCVRARAPLVSLTVSILSNSSTAYQTTFDRSDYAYPLPQTGLSTFGFAGELYVPAGASCSDEVVSADVRRYPKPEHANGIVFLPYRSCRGQWEQLLHDEAANGRAAGALLYSLKDDAAQAAERAAVDLTHVHTPVWMVNAVAGEYLTSVLVRLAQNHTDLARAPNGASYGPLEESVRLAVDAAVDRQQVREPRVFVAISRSAMDVAAADRNFFLKAMIGVGITGIVCFVIAMVVRYFDCVRVGQRQQRRWRWNAGGDEESEFARAERKRRRVLRQHELDLLPCAVIGPARNERPPAVHLGSSRAGFRSCPQLPGHGPGEALALHRMHSIQNTQALAADDSWDSVECAICLDEIRVGCVVRRLPCPHVFHAV